MNDELKADSSKKYDYNRVYDRAIDIISRRDHAKNELREKLLRKFGFDSAETVDAVCNELEEIGLIDDEKFARAYADELVRLKHLSPRGIRAEMMKRGVPKEIVTPIIEELDIDVRVAINELLDTKYSRYDLSIEGSRTKVFNALVRMGYLYNDIKSVFYDRTREL